ncbi:MAG: MBL fold metallo-hydrolase [Gammaproteobacteria bacterium]|nr:MBL fold metallo-hydrolase [Gammaproteobacteria bacterium]
MTGEHALRYPLGETLPEPGTAVEVAPGVRWLRMPLPFALNHINLWLLRDRVDGRDGWCIVDCGIADEATRSAWEQVFATGIDGLPVLRVIVTHLHPDHAGLCHWLTERWRTEQSECRLWMSATDFAAARVMIANGSAVGGDGAANFFRRHGLTDEKSLEQVRLRWRYYANMVPAMPDGYRRLMDGQVVVVGEHAWECIAGYGHAPEHISLWCAKTNVLISGDMVLPRISTNVSVGHTEPEGDPLPLYLRSIAAMRRLPGDTLVLPSHGKPFMGLHNRVIQLEQHHKERLDVVRSACSGQPRSAGELLQVMFRRSLDLHQTTFAMGEAIAHLNALAGRGEVRHALHPDGVIRFESR